MAHHKVLNALAANDVKKQNNSNTETVDPAVLSGSSAA
jgi:hypothetical protein